MQQMCSLIDKKLKEIEGVNDLESVDLRKLSLVPDVVIPPKFKMPKFEKYDGTKCPCHNGFPLDLDDHKNKWSRHRSFLYGCDRSPGAYVLKLGTEIPN